MGHHITKNLLYDLSRKAAACCGPIKTEYDVLVEKGIKGVVCME